MIHRELHNSVFQETPIVQTDLDGVILWIIQGVQEMLFSNWKHVIYETAIFSCRVLQWKKAQMCSIVLGNYRLGMGQSGLTETWEVFCKHCSKCGCLRTEKFHNWQSMCLISFFRYFFLFISSISVYLQGTFPIARLKWDCSLWATVLLTSVGEAQTSHVQMARCSRANPDCQCPYIPHALTNSSDIYF